MIECFKISNKLNEKQLSTLQGNYLESYKYYNFKLIFNLFLLNILPLYITSY